MKVFEVTKTYCKVVKGEFVKTRAKTTTFPGYENAKAMYEIISNEYSNKKEYLRNWYGINKVSFVKTDVEKHTSEHIVVELIVLVW